MFTSNCVLFISALQAGLSLKLYASEDLNDSGFRNSMTSHSSGSFKLRTPHFSLNPKRWFDVDKELAHWNEVNARLKVFMNAKIEPRESHDVDYSAVLRKDVAVADKLDKEVQRINAAIQAETTVGDDVFSLLETEDGYTPSDWNFCSCPVGPNGTLVYPERNWPRVSLPSSVPSLLELRTASTLKISFRGKRVAIGRDSNCDCTNPWEGYYDPSGSSICTINQRTTVCLIRRNIQQGIKSPEELRQEGLDLIRTIDSFFGIDGMTIVPSQNSTGTMSSTAATRVENGATMGNDTKVTSVVSSTPVVNGTDAVTTNNSSQPAPVTGIANGTSSFAQVWNPFQFSF